MTDIKNIIENAWDNVSDLTSENKDIAEAVREVIGKLDNGEYRIAEKNFLQSWCLFGNNFYNYPRIFLKK